MINITKEPLDPQSIAASVHNSSNGAIVTFIGTTRDTNVGRDVLYLEYEAYSPMAENKLAEIAGEVLEKYGVSDASIVHRIGRLEVGEASLVVAIASPHRNDAFAACRYCVDRIKEMVPIWKKEVFRGGEVWIQSPEDLATRT